MAAGGAGGASGDEDGDGDGDEVGGDEDYHALQASLEEYVTDRLAPLSEALDRQLSGGGGGGRLRRCVPTSTSESPWFAWS